MAHSVQTARKYPFWLKAAFLVSVCLMMLLLAEVASQAILYHYYGFTSFFGPPSSQESTTVYDPLLGWNGRPRLHIPNHYGPDKPLTYNSAGLRGHREYTELPPKGRYRIICIGDSFTQGWGEGDEDTYPAWLESLEPRLETINMGMAAYGIDQAYLRYERDGTQYRADMLILAVISDDFNRIGRDTFKMQRFKPWLNLGANGSLETRGVPVPSSSGSWSMRLQRKSALYQFWRRFYFDHLLKPDVWALGTAIFGELQRIADKRGQRFVLVYFPTLAELRFAKEGNSIALADRCAEFARDSGIDFVDITPAFDPVSASELDTYFTRPDDPHYSGLGNRLVAEVLLQQLFPDGVPTKTASTGHPTISSE